MRFREYGDVRPQTVVATSAAELDSKIKEIGDKCNIVDLQYSTTDTGGAVEYSALLLVTVSQP